LSKHGEEVPIDNLRTSKNKRVKNDKMVIGGGQPSNGQQAGQSQHFLTDTEQYAHQRNQMKNSFNSRSTSTLLPHLRMRNNALRNSGNSGFVEGLNPSSENELNQTTQFDGGHERKSSADYSLNKHQILKTNDIPIQQKPNLNLIGPYQLNLPISRSNNHIQMMNGNKKMRNSGMDMHIKNEFSNSTNNIGSNKQTDGHALIRIDNSGVNNIDANSSNGSFYQRFLRNN